MEDAVSIHPSFLTKENHQTSNLHYFGVYDGHGCSHVATRCKDRLHLLVKEEINKKVDTLKDNGAKLQSYGQRSNRLEPWPVRASDAGVGRRRINSAIMTPDKIVVANCGDSRAVLCRNGKAVPLSNDHKPDRTQPDPSRRRASHILGRR